MSRQNLAVLACYYLGYSRIRNLLYSLHHKPVTLFLLFHDIPPNETADFEKKIEFLKRIANIVSLEDFFAGKLSDEELNLVLTFDDGYRSWVTTVIPILKKQKACATFFIASGFVNLSREKEAEYTSARLFPGKYPHPKISGGLRNQEIRQIVDEGFIVGGHTLNHSNLASLTEEDTLRFEIAEDKGRLEQLTGRKVNYFAYPFGVYQNAKISIPKILDHVGYTGAVTTISGVNKSGSDPFMLKRESTPVSLHGQLFRAWALGNYEAVRFLKQRIAALS